MENFRIIKSYFKTTQPRKSHIFLMLLTNMAHAVPYMFTPLIYGFIIRFLTENNLTMLIYALIAYFGLKIFAKIGSWINFGFIKKYYRNIYTHLQNKLIDKVEWLSADSFTAENKGNILNVENTDIKVLCSFYDWLNNFSVYIISFAVAAVILIRTSIWLAVLGVAVDLTVIFILGIFHKRYEKLIMKSTAQTDRETAMFSQIISGISEIKVFNIMNKLKPRYVKINENYLNYNDKIIDNSRIRDVITPTITMLAEAAIMIFMSFCVFRRGFGVDTVVVVVSYFGTLFSNLDSIASSLGQLKLVKVSIDRYNNIVQDSDNSCDNFGTVSEVCRRGKIEFKNVTFGYENEPVLSNFSIELEPSSITALVGKSGSGKSTVFNLLTRIRKPQSGTITIDGTDIFSFTNEAYSQNVAIIRQNPFIFNMSIYENLALINPDRAAVIEACRRVNLHEYIMTLPDGYDTVINEDATDLSGGQKQRLAIARTLLKGSKVILCDEITSALDKNLSESIFALLKELKKDHTIIMITHKPNEAEKADKIIDLQQMNNYLKGAII